jgi:regulatory protein
MSDPGTLEPRSAPAPPEDPDSVAEAERVALRILAGAGQSAAALQRRLQRRGFTEDAAAAATAAMVGHGYVNDEALAQAIAARSRRTGHGRIQVASQLRARGVAHEAIAGTLGSVDAEAERATALEVGRRVWERSELVPWARRRDRVAGTLQRRGFDAETVHWVCRHLERDS